MGREKIGDEVMKVRFSDGTFARIDCVSGNRSDFIRSAVCGVLDFDVSAVAPVLLGPVSVPKKNLIGSVLKKPVVAAVVLRDRRGVEVDTSGFRSDSLLLLEHIFLDRVTSRQASISLGWLGLRFDRAEKELLSSGVVWIDGGFLCHSGGD
ncbi:MAG: hypothetical protein L3J05_07925 [Robiginitomaculum sp.]|nr:hypothetical protein [Robiginitomaculum sp.]